MLSLNIAQAVRSSFDFNGRTYPWNDTISGGIPGYNYFDGVIDDVKIFNTALSDAQIKQQARVAGF